MGSKLFPLSTPHVVCRLAHASVGYDRRRIMVRNDMLAGGQDFTAELEWLCLVIGPTGPCYEIRSGPRDTHETPVSGHSARGTTTVGSAYLRIIFCQRLCRIGPFGLFQILHGSPGKLAVGAIHFLLLFSPAVIFLIPKQCRVCWERSKPLWSLAIKVRADPRPDLCPKHTRHRIMHHTRV